MVVLCLNGFVVELFLMDELLKTYVKSENNLFQSEAWGKYQELLGRKIFRIDCNDSHILMVKIPLFGNYNYLYCPRAPQISNDEWHLFLNKAREIAKAENVVFVRVEPFIAHSGILKQLKFNKVKWFSPLSQQFSPMDTLLLDLSKTEEVLLDEMKSKWRYNIKLAGKKGVKIRKSKELADLEKFHKLSEGMLTRGYSSFDFEHYKSLYETLSSNHNLTMYVAEEGKDVLAVILVSNYNETAIYLHGASSDEKRELMPNHLLQWTAILDAKERGCKVYDFWGVAPDDNEKHLWSGITRFKLGFGGERVHFIGAYDYTFKPFWYTMLCSINFMRKLVKR